MESFLLVQNRVRNNKHQVRKTKHKLQNKSLTVWAKKYWALRGCTISLKKKTKQARQAHVGKATVRN